MLQDYHEALKGDRRGDRDTVMTVEEAVGMLAWEDEALTVGRADSRIDVVAEEDGRLVAALPASTWPIEYHTCNHRSQRPLMEKEKRTTNISQRESRPVGPSRLVSSRPQFAQPRT